VGFGGMAHAKKNGFKGGPPQKNEEKGGSSEKKAMKK